jgi:geranylgeranyl diphosphate synthase, type II
MSSLPNIKKSQAQIKALIKTDITENANFRSIFPGLFSMEKIAEYALNSGKRLRPMITLSIQGSNDEPHFALFVEYVHNSSLIVDDLPCMDNDTERRGQATLHVKYGEHVAQLTAYNLMVTAMKHLADGFRDIKKFYSVEEYDWIYDNVNQEVSDNLGYQGICGGQFLDLMICTNKDLQSRSPREQRELLLKIIKLKTGCLFSLSFILGWIAKGGILAAIEDIKSAGYAFGVCYQIIDDLRDVEKDTERNGGYNNICRYFSRNEILDMFTDHIERFASVLSQYEMWNPVLQELYNYLLLSFKKEIIKRKCPAVPPLARLKISS